MKAKCLLFLAGMLLATIGTGLGQPTITTQPTNWPLVSVGASVANRVSAFGTAPLAYQWCLNGAPVAGQTKTSISLANVQLADAGDYTAVVTDAVGSVTSRVVRLVVDTTFTKITTGPVVEDIEASVTGVPGDYDNDGRVDLLVLNAQQNARPSLYRNLGGDTFVRVTNALTRAIGMSWGAQWGDLDNDGDLDLVLYHPALPLDPITPARNEMFRNDGGGVFTPMTNIATLIASFWTDVTWVDHNRDGLLDLFATTQGFSVSQPLDDYFFQNLGDGTFSAWTTNEVGVVIIPQALTAGPAWCDIDGDGDLDLYVSRLATGAATNFLYRNDNGRLIPVTAGSLPARRSTWAATWADFNNDGLFDLFTGGENGTNALHLNRGNWVFEDVTMASGLALAGNVFFAPAGDFDNDGDLDLYVPDYDKADVLYVNRGDGTFERANLGLMLTDGVRNSATWFDYNNDGFLDLFLPCGDQQPARNLLYRNSLPQYGNTNHWLKVKLEGTASNRSGIGARVMASATIRGKAVSQVRQILMAALSPQELIAHFGLGDAAKVDLVRVEWPSGIVREYQDVEANQIITLVENQPPAADASATELVNISPNGVDAAVTLDGSRSSDPDGDPLQYLWLLVSPKPSEGGSTLNSQPSTVLASGVVAVVVLPVGLNPIELVVSDGVVSATNALTIEVITTAEATRRLIVQAQTEWRRSQPLVATLYAALHSIERGNAVAACNQLVAFQNKVRAQLGRRDPALAESFIQMAQDIIDALSR